MKNKISRHFVFVLFAASLFLASAPAMCDNPPMGDDMENALSDPQLTAVTRDFGPTIIPMRNLPIRSQAATADNIAWSSWWYPKFQDTLFHDDNSTLEKYDQYVGQRGNNSASQWEQQNVYNPDAQRWEGLCDAWSLAAISVPEPKHSVTVNGVTFSTGDIKALLLKTYDNLNPDALKVYGERFEGDDTSWIFPDIFPDQLHRFIEIQLFQNHKPFIMDHDPGIAVWTVPVYKANYVITQDPSNPNQVFVKLWLYNAAQLSSVSQIDSVGTQQETREYDYTLRGTRNANGDLVVQSGEWIKGDFVDSRSDHPDYVITIPDPSKIANRAGKNPNINPAVVDKLLQLSIN